MNVPEKHIQKTILHGLAMMGIPAHRLNSGAYSTTSTSGKSTFIRYGFPGCPDIVAFLDGHTLWIEVKARRGKLTPHQVSFQKLCRERNIPYIVARDWSDIEECLASVKND